MCPKKNSSSINDDAIIIFQEKILQWTCERHATNQPLNREILGDKIIDLSTELGLRNFKCSKSWTTKFLKKHGFSPSLTSLQGPIFNDYKDWIHMMRSYIMQYRYKNVFQVDEMGMYHDTSPDKIPESLDYLTCKSGEQRENRVTVLLCCNASGVEKLPPVICGKFENRLPFDNHKCQYYTNQNAWLTPDIFKLWLSQLNTQMSHLNRKILLLLNRTRIHMLKDAVLSNISLMYFPNEFPPNLQPLKSDIFHYVKMIYRRSFTKKMLQSNFDWTMVDTINGIVNSWESVPEEFILSSFRRTHIRSDDDLLQVFCPEWENLNLGISFRSYVIFDDNLCVSSPSTTRKSKRLAKIETVGSSRARLALGGSRDGSYYNPIELGDSDSDEVLVEEVSDSSQLTSKFDRDLPSPKSFDRIANKSCEKVKVREIVENRDSKPAFTILDSNSRHYQSHKENSTSDARPLADTMILYLSDIAKNAAGKVADNMPEVAEMTSGLNGWVGTGDDIDRSVVIEDAEAASITRKRLREETDDIDVPNDVFLQRAEKKIATERIWSDIYEHNFVFGVAESPQANSSACLDFQMAIEHPTAQINSTEKEDDLLEKKTIFTISHAPLSEEQNH